ncbi:MAG TPA: 2Fe-2S iron-sulfur cluster-binding protein [Edaphocola sp.]|nr:2Fe-2S iron-sulfur cluster-binding protein [Edaphocola sp.]
MEENIIKIYVERADGSVHEMECPTDMGFSLMEIMKANEMPILATCGGMALCATCCVDVLEGGEHLPEIEDAEYAMLDTLPDLLPISRLGCQLRITPEMNNMRVKIHEEQQ